MPTKTKADADEYRPTERIESLRAEIGELKSQYEWYLAHDQIDRALEVRYKVDDVAFDIMRLTEEVTPGDF